MMAALTEAQEIKINVELGGASIPAERCVIEEGMSEPDRVVVEFGNLFDVDFGPLMETDAEISVTLGGLEARQFSRRLAAATFLHADEGRLHYRLEFRPRFFFCCYAMNTRKFRDMTTEAIVDQVLGEEGVTHSWRTRRTSKSRPYCVQYRETTKAFIERLLEYEGFYYYFDAAGTMVIGDTSSAELMVDGLPVYPLLESSGGLAHGELGVTSLVRGTRVGSGHATVNDYNFKTPKQSLLQTSSAAIDSDLEIYDYPTGYRDAAVGATLAGLRLDALVAEKRYVEGSSSVPQFAAARLVEISHSEAIDFGGTYLLVRVNHDYKAHKQSERFGQAAGYENTFFAIPSDVPWRPPLKTPHPVIEGNHTAHVRGPVGEEIHTDVYGRAKVQLHWDREAKQTDEDSRWIRTLQETSSSMVVARVGWEIVVGYIDGDPDRPIGVGRNMNGKMMPMYGQPDRKNIMTIKTESYPGKNGFNELRMDDSAGGMRMDWHAQRDHMNVVENDRTEKVLNNHFHLVKQGVTRIVAGNQLVTVGADETKDVQVFYSESVSQNRDETIGGNENVEVKVSSSMSTKGDESVTIGAVRFSLVGVGAVSTPSPKYIAQLIVPHTLGVSHDDMLAGGMTGAGANDGHEAGNLTGGGILGANATPFGGDGTFGGFGGGDAPGGSGGGGVAGPQGGGDAGGGGAAGVLSTMFDSLLSSGSARDAASAGLGAIAGQVGGSGPVGQGLQSAVSALTSGQGVSGALSQGVQGAIGAYANQVGGPLGAGIQGLANGLTSGQGLGSALGQGLNSALAQSGSLGGALANGSLGSALSSAFSGGGLGALGSAFSSIGSAISKDAGYAMELGKTVSAAHDLLANARAKVLGGEALGEMFKGSINKNTTITLTRIIGAAQLFVAGGTIMTTSNYLFNEVIGGLKMTTAKEGSVMQSAQDFLDHTVFGMILRKSKEDMSMSTKKTQVRVTGVTKLHSDEKVELRGKVIEIEGQNSVTLKSGDLFIQISPSGTIIKGDVKVKSGTKIKVAGGPDKLTA